ncbi:MAG: hypothetical protein DMF77_07360, partial [Acidobacteria bacterium]
QGRNPLELTAADCMTSPPVTVTPEASLSECCDILEAKQIRRVPVVDHTGRCIGMVSQADIARHAPKHEAAEVLKQVSQPSVGASAIAP